jgi:hypothetical protein
MQDPREMIGKQIWIAWFIAQLLVIVTAIVLITTQHLMNYSMIHAEAIFLATLSILLAFAVPIFGILLFSTLNNIVISSNRKKKMRIKVNLSISFLLFILFYLLIRLLIFGF